MSSYERPGTEVPNNFPPIFQDPKRFFGIVLAGLAFIAASTIYFQVEADSVGVVMRFGKHIETTKPGLHFKLPFGIDRVLMVPVDRQLKMEFGFDHVS